MPAENAAEAALPEQCRTIAVNHLLEISAHLRGQQTLDYYQTEPFTSKASSNVDLTDVKGQYQIAKRALEVAAAGCHNLLFLALPRYGQKYAGQSTAHSLAGIA